MRAKGNLCGGKESGKSPILFSFCQGLWFVIACLKDAKAPRGPVEN